MASPISATVLNDLLGLRDLLGTQPLFALGLLLVVGYLFGKLAGRINMPEISGFIVAGILLGESVTGFVPRDMAHQLSLLPEVALGMIALSVGGEFRASTLRRLGTSIVVIAGTQMAFTLVAVTATLALLGLPLPFAMLMGTIACATSPASLFAVANDLRARGRFVELMHGSVAVNDAGTLILFGLVFAVAGGMIAGGDAPAGSMVVHAIYEIGFSLLVGAIAGVLLHLFSRGKRDGYEVLISGLGLFLVVMALTIVLDLSPLLTNMVAGAVLANLSQRQHPIFRFLEPFTPPIYALFFVIAGVELQLEILTQTDVLILGGGYIVARAVAKYYGVYSACAILKTEPATRTNLGICMFPQAGVAIGLVLLVQTSPILQGIPAESAKLIETMVNIVLLSVLINEIGGPPLARAAIIRGAEIDA